MTNEEKAREIALDAKERGFGATEAYCAAMEMAEWKDQQMIEKACELYRKELVSLNNLLVAYDKEAFANWLMIDDSVNDFRNALKKAMKGDMTNEKKARQLAIQSTKDVDDNGNEVYNVFVEAALLEMAQWKDEQLKQTREDAKSLYDEISDCIDSLVKSRLSKNGIRESNALQQMESIMVKTQQFLQTI